MLPIAGLPTARRSLIYSGGMGLALLGYALLPGVPLALLAALLFTLLAAACPRLGLAAVLATLPVYLHPRELGGLALSLPETALLLATLATAARAIALRYARGGLPQSFPLPLSPRSGARTRVPSAGRSDAGGTTPQATAFDPWVTLLLAAALLSLLPSEYLRLSLRALRTLVLEPVLFFYLVVAVCPTIRTLRPLWIALLTCASAVAALAIAQVVTNVQTVEVEGVRRALGTYASPNHLGLYLGRALPFALAFALFSSRGRRGYAAAAAVLSLALLATFSLGAWLSGAASVVALLVIRARTMPVAPGRRLLLSTLLAGVAASAGGWLVLARLGVERVTSQLSLEGATATFRRQIWTSALAMLHDHPILGIGLDNFLYRYQLQYMLPTAWQEPNISHPHNWLLHFWLELGLLGAIALIGLLGTFARLAAARLRATIDPTERALVAGAGASMMGLAVHGAVDNSYFLVDLAILFWWHLAVVAVAHHAGQSSPTPS